MTAIRPLRLEDVDALRRLELDLFGPLAWSADSIRDEVERVGRDRIGSVALSGDQVVGYGVVLVGEVADLLRIAVAADTQRQGVATLLLADLQTRARAAGSETMMLEVAAQNAPARAFYEARGFHEVARRARYYADGSTAIVMSTTLAAATTSDDQAT